MVTNIVGYWVFGLPIGYALTFTFGWGVKGLWIGLSVGLIIVAITLTATWAYRSTHLALVADPSLCSLSYDSRTLPQPPTRTHESDRCP
jgi:hypothetical protein